MADYSEMSYDELVAANQELMERRAAVSKEIEDEQLALHEVLDLRVMEQSLFGSMTDNERETMARALASMPPAPEADVVEISPDDVASVESVEGSN